jgi:hypothetical protein
LLLPLQQTSCQRWYRWIACSCKEGTISIPTNRAWETQSAVANKTFPSRAQIKNRR